MAQETTVLTPEEQELCVAVHNVSHPISVIIVRFLKENGPATSEEIAKAIGVKEPAISLHLLNLSTIGFVVFTEKPTEEDLKKDPNLILVRRHVLQPEKIKRAIENFQKLF